MFATKKQLSKVLNHSDTNYLNINYSVGLSITYSTGLSIIYGSDTLDFRSAFNLSRLLPSKLPGLLMTINSN